jgi:hypothetical protein
LKLSGWKLCGPIDADHGDEFAGFIACYHNSYTKLLYVYHSLIPKDNL